MTKKDYVLIAAALGDSLAAHPNPIARRALAAVQERITVLLAEDNPRFDAARFTLAIKQIAQLGGQPANLPPCGLTAGGAR